MCKNRLYKGSYFYKLMVCFLLGITLVTMSGCSKDNAGKIIDGYTQSGKLKLEQVQLPQIGDLIAVILTDKGEIKMRLFPEIAPETVALFTQRVESGYYNGVAFDRIEKNFLIQIGENDLFLRNNNQEVVYLKDELDINYRHLTGAVGMGKVQETTEYNDRRTTHSFYFITQDGVDETYFDAMDEIGEEAFPKDVVEAYRAFGGVPRLDFSYTVFAQVFYGLDVIRTINQITVNPATSIPDERVKIISIEIETYDEE